MTWILIPIWAWVLVVPQIVLYYEEDKQFAIIDAEFGMMLDKLLGTKGHSMYVRPLLGIGEERTTDGS